MDPSLCPLCRKPFLPERSKKLITGELEVREADGIENKKAIELLTKLVHSLDTEEHDSTVLEIDLWLSAGNTHASLQKVQEILKEYLVLKSERSANLRSIRRLQRDMCRLQADHSTEKQSASAMKQELLSQVEELQERIRKLEGRRRDPPTITFNYNPLPTPPEPFPQESLPFLANLQQNINLTKADLSQSSDLTTRNTVHPNAVPTKTSVEGSAAAAPRAPSPDQTSSPSNLVPAVNERANAHRSAIIRGASPNQRFIPGSVYEESSSSAGTDLYGETAPPMDPFVLATGYFTEYAVGFGEAYDLSHRHLQSSSRRNRQGRRATEPTTPSVVELLNQSNASSSRTLDDQLSQQLADISLTSQSAHRPLGLQDFYTTSTILPSSNRRDDPAPVPRVPSPRPSTLSSSSSTPIHDEPWVPLERQAPSTLSTSPAPLELYVTTASVNRASNSSSLLSAPASSNSRRFRPASPTSALPSSVTSVPSPDVTTSPSSRTLSSSRAREQRSRSDMTSFEISWDSPMRVPAPISPNASLRRRSVFSASDSAQSSSLLGAVDSPASTHTMDSWGTVSTNNPNRVLHRPFRSAHQISSVSDLSLRLFDEFTNSNGGSVSQRASLLSDEAQSLSDSHIGFEGSDNIGNYGNDSQNRTPRVVPRPLPDTESVSSHARILPSFAPSRDDDRHGNISSNITSSYGDFDHNHSQHHRTPPDASETWHRATMDLTSMSYAHTHTYSHSRTISDLVTDRSFWASRHRTLRSSPTGTSVYDNSTSSRREALASTNALGLTDLASSPESRISAPTPIMPSRSFLRYYN
ncbi:hypothetical protein E4T56_gene20261 [Termitomyces sp. T112]|nr:hypothetical protein E4T56_gene20261 [Termitomyces sp. T112]